MRIEYQSWHDLLTEMGKDGWELMAISTRSSFLSGTDNQPGEARDHAGYPSDEVWVFKRPKE
jgi:hypothetical protein